MPELIQESTPPVPPPSSNPGIPPLEPPGLPPWPRERKPPSYPWEEHAAFRSTFLMHFTTPEHRAALETIGQLLYDTALEVADQWPPWPESTTKAEMRAIAADLRHAEAFLWSVGQEHLTVSLAPMEETLSVMAVEWSIMVGRLAKSIEGSIPVWRPLIPPEPEETTE